MSVSTALIDDGSSLFALMVPNSFQGAVDLYKSNAVFGTSRVAYSTYAPSNASDDVLGTSDAIHTTFSMFLQSLKAPLPICLIELPKVTEVRLVQPEKAFISIVVTEFGMVTEVRLLQPEKMELLIVLTELPMVTEVRLVQLEKALVPIFLTELGISTEVRLEQPQKASSPIDVMEFGMVTEVRPVQFSFL